MEKITLDIYKRDMIMHLVSSALQTKKETRESGEPDEFDELVAANTGKSLATRLGNSPDMIMKKSKAKKSDGMKQTKLNFKKVCIV